MWQVHVASSPPPNPPLPWWRALLTLHLGGAAILGVASLLTDSEASYLEEIAGASGSWGRLALYACSLLLYALVVEVALRGGLQGWLQRRLGAWPAVLLTALLYGALHLGHGAANAAYAAALGLWLGWWRWRGVPTHLFVLWHMQWDMLALGLTLAWALLAPGAARSAVLLAYKAEQVQAGRLQLHPAHGWLDAAHYHGTQRRICQLWRRWPQQAPQLHTERVCFARLDGSPWCPQRSYRLDPLPPQEALPAAASLSLDAAWREEQAQERAPLWYGLRLSAWSFEDLPSAQAAALELLAAPQPMALCLALPSPRDSLRAPIPGATVALEAWRQQGPALVEAPQRSWPLRSLSPRQRESWHSLEHHKKFWHLETLSKIEGEPQRVGGRQLER